MAVILVIDDEAGMRSTIARMLRQGSHNVLLAPDGRIGLELFDRHQPDVVITDVVMPEKEGIETIMEIRGRSSATRIIAISGKSPIGPVDFLSAAKQLGADYTLSKPFRVQELLGIVENAMRLRN
jgi:DNA-binding response OmpR family regulator